MKKLCVLLLVFLCLGITVFAGGQTSTPTTSSTTTPSSSSSTLRIDRATYDWWGSQINSYTYQISIEQRRIVGYQSQIRANLQSITSCQNGIAVNCAAMAVYADYSYACGLAGDAQGIADAFSSIADLQILNNQLNARIRDLTTNNGSLLNQISISQSLITSYQTQIAYYQDCRRRYTPY